MTPKGAPSVGHGDMGTPRCPEPARPCPATQGATLASGYGHPQHPIPSVPLERWPPWTPRTAPQPPAQPCCHPLGTRRTRGTSRGWCMTWGHALVPGAVPVPAAGHSAVPPRGLQVPTRLDLRCVAWAWLDFPPPSLLPSPFLPSPDGWQGRGSAAAPRAGSGALQTRKRPDPRRIALGTPSLNPQPRFPAAALPAGPHPCGAVAVLPGRPFLRLFLMRHRQGLAA